MRAPTLLFLLLFVTASGGLFAHGASKGLHVHVEPDPAKTGQKVAFHATANATIDKLTWSCGDGVAHTLPPQGEEEPDAERRWSWTIPDDTPAGSLPCRFEVRTPDGKRYASLLLMIASDKPIGQETPVPPTPQ